MLSPVFRIPVGSLYKVALPLSSPASWGSGHLVMTENNLNLALVHSMCQDLMREFVKFKCTRDSVKEKII